MKKVAIVFVLAVFVPSLVLAWLAVRSLRDQQFVLERQQSLIYQQVADALAKEADSFLVERQREFGLQVEAILAEGKAVEAAPAFDDRLRRNWPLAEVGFVVSLEGNVLCPSLFSRAEAKNFRLQNDRFLCNRESVEVYWQNPKAGLNSLQTANTAYENKADRNISGQSKDVNPPPNTPSQLPVPGPPLQPQLDQTPNISSLPVEPTQSANTAPTPKGFYLSSPKENYAGKGQKRSVVPQQQLSAPQQKEQQDGADEFSKITASEAEFRHLVGDASEGRLARFLQNKLHLMIWYRSPRDPQLVFGAQLDLARMKQGLRELVRVEPPLQREVCVALLDDNARPVAVSPADFRANWRRPIVATEIGEALPHWEMAVYLLDPARLQQSARTLTWTLGLLISVLVLAIGFGSWLIVADLQRQLTLARQKTDFVSNVSHELKTPLTSIRMFSELLAEGRVSDREKQRSYLNIITAEAARLTRLINNVLDFSRLERGEKKYRFQKCDVVEVARETVETYRPHLEQNGFKLECEFPDAPAFINGDHDALAQVLVNLLSNAEKYSTNGRKEIAVCLRRQSDPLPFVEVSVLDRGPGVPRGCEEKIFEQFFRANDSLSSGIQGSGLGLTLARQIARAHGGEVAWAPREGGGSCFVLRLPCAPS